MMAAGTLSAPIPRSDEKSELRDFRFNRCRNTHLDTVAL
jgi:hypothetical protein